MAKTDGGTLNRMVDVDGYGCGSSGRRLMFRTSTFILHHWRQDSSVHLSLSTSQYIF